MDILSQVDQSIQELTQSLKEQNRFLQDIEAAQRKLTFRKREAIETIATLTGALQAYEQCLLMLKKEENPRDSAV